MFGCGRWLEAIHAFRWKIWPVKWLEELNYDAENSLRIILYEFHGYILPALSKCANQIEQETATSTCPLPSPQYYYCYNNLMTRIELCNYNSKFGAGEFCA